MSDFEDSSDLNLIATRTDVAADPVGRDPHADDTVVHIAREVISRLSQSLVADANHVERPRTEQIDQFCDALIGADEDKAAGLIDELVLNGASFNTVYLGYIAGAAIRLGQRWEDDTSTFVEMTVASGRMYSIMRNMRRAIVPPLSNHPRHAFFAAVPDESHTLGVTMAADLFRRRGWQIDVEIGRTHDALVKLVSQSDHRFIGLSASRPDRIVCLAKLIVDLRICKPHAFIMVSGNISEITPGIKNLVDADFIAHDAPSAIVEMEQARRAWELNG